MRRHSFVVSVGWGVVVAGLLCLCSPAHAEVASVTTKLLGRIDSRRLAAGNPFFVNALSDWKQGLCKLRPGDTLEGRVVSVEHAVSGVRREQIQLRFLPQVCAGQETLLAIPILVALQSPQLRSDAGTLQCGSGAHATLRVPSDRGRPGVAPALGRAGRGPHPSRALAVSFTPSS